VHKNLKFLLFPFSLIDYGLGWTFVLNVWYSIVLNGSNYLQINLNGSYYHSDPLPMDYHHPHHHIMVLRTPFLRGMTKTVHPMSSRLDDCLLCSWSLVMYRCWGFYSYCSVILSCWCWGSYSHNRVRYVDVEGSILRLFHLHSIAAAVQHSCTEMLQMWNCYKY